MNNLRNYYAAERRREESSKVSGSGTESLYISNWTFSQSLQFLRDNYTSRRIVSNITEEEDGEISQSTYKVSNPH